MKRLYEELKEDFDRMQRKYDELIKSTEGQKLEHENILQEARNKFDTDLQNLEKNFQEMLKEKNEMEYNLNEETKKVKKAENDLLELKNEFSTLNVKKSRLEDDFVMEKSKMEDTMNEYKDDIDKLKKEKSDLLSIIKIKNLESETERQNNQLTLNILKEQIKQLHGELAEMEEEKKGLQEAVSLYEKQMKAEQLMDMTQIDELDLIREEDEDEDQEADDEELSQGIPEDAETELSTIIYEDVESQLNLKKRNSKSNVMSISELEPASRVPIHQQYLSEDSVEINDDIDNYGKPLMTRPSSIKVMTLSPVIDHEIHRDGNVTPPQYTLTPTKENKENKENNNNNNNNNLSVDAIHAKFPSNISIGSVNSDFEPTPLPSLPADSKSNNDLMMIGRRQEMKSSKSTNDVFATHFIQSRVRSDSDGKRNNNNNNKAGKLSPMSDTDITDFIYQRSIRSHKKSNTASGHVRSSTRAELNVWKDKYAELKEKQIQRAKQIAHKDIELKSLQDKLENLQEIIRESKNKIDSLEQDLENSQQGYVKIYQQQVKLKKDHEREIGQLKKLLNDAKDEIATLSAENERLKQWKLNVEKEHKKKEKLHTKQLKFNEELMNEIFDLNNEVKQLTDINIEMKSKFENVIAETSTTMDQYQTNKNKLDSVKKELKEEKKQSTRLKNKVSALNKEVMSLNQTIQNLESLFSEHSHLLQSKNRRIKHLGKQNMEKEQSITRLSSKLKKRERHIKGYMEAEEESFRKSYSAKDKRLGMLRERNMKLLTKVEDLDKKLSELQLILKETKLKLKDEVTNHRMDNTKLQVEISKLRADNHKLMSEKQEIQYERDNAIKLNKELEIKIDKEKLQNVRMIKDIKNTIANIDFIENKYFDILSFLDVMDMNDDELYKFVDRCRNIFINTNKLTNKLTIKLIEGADRAIYVYHNSVSHFKLLIDNCINIKKRFSNIEKSYRSLDYHKYEVYQSALCSIYNLGGSTSAAANVHKKSTGNITPNTAKRNQTNSARSTRRISNARNKDVIPKMPLIAKDLIRKPVQFETRKVPISAYHEIYYLLSQHIEKSLNDLTNITNIYNQPFDLSIYQQSNHNDLTLPKRSNHYSKNNDDDDDDDQDNDNSTKTKNNLPSPIVTDFEDDDDYDDNKEANDTFGNDMKYQDNDDDIDYDERGDQVLKNKKYTIEFDDKPEIDWRSLNIDPTTQRLYPGAQETNHRRFEQIMGEFNDSSRKFRKEQTRTLMELDGAWHQYHINAGPNNDLSPKLSSREQDEYKGGSNNNSTNTNNNGLKTPKTKGRTLGIRSRTEGDDDDDDNNQMYLSPLTLKVSSQGMHHKRYSIV